MAYHTTFESDDELASYLDSLSPEEATAFLADYAATQEAAAEELTETSDESEGSAAQIQDNEAILAGIEQGNSPLDSDKSDNVSRIQKSTGRMMMPPTNMPRYHHMTLTGIQANPGVTGGVQFRINETIKWGPAGFDTVIGLTDISPIITPSSQHSISGRMYMTWGSSGNGHVCKIILVTWLSGYTKEFQMCASDEPQNFGGISIGGNGSTSFSTWKCNAYYVGNNPWYLQYPFIEHMSWQAQCTADQNFFIKTEPLVDPGNRFTKGEWIRTMDQATWSGWSHFSISPFPRDPMMSGLITNPMNKGVFSPDASQPGEQLMRVIQFHFNSSGGLNHPLKTPGGAMYFDVGSIEASYPGFTGNPVGTHNAEWNSAERYLVSSGGIDLIYSSIAQIRAIQGSHPETFYNEGLVYADNLTPCGVPPEVPNDYYVCLNASAPEYYFNTCTDCFGNVIPPLECNGTIYANIYDGGCCTLCDIQVDRNTTCATYGNSDGYVTWDAADPTGSAVPSGTPFGSNSLYTVTVITSTGVVLATQAPAGGAAASISCTTNTTASTEHQVSVSSNSQIVGGMSVTGTGIPAGTYVSMTGQTGTWNTNITVFELVDNIGTSVNATVAATNTLVFSTGFTGVFGGLLPNNAGGLGVGTFYTLSLEDDDGCTVDSLFTICEDPPPSGCTDSTALNYNSAAVTDDGSCIICNASSGQLSDPSTSYTGDLYTGTVGVVDATGNSSCVPQSDGEISLTASMQNTALAYLELDGTQSYTFTLFPLTNQGDISSAGGAVATQAGLAVTTFGGTPTHTFSSLAYGHYAIKVELLDNDEAHGLEPCYSYFFGTIKVPVCDDATATNYNTSIPADLIVNDYSCCTYPVNCCQLTGILEDTVQRGTDCNPFLHADVACDPGSTGVTGYWELNSVMIAGSAFNIGAQGGGATTIWLVDNMLNSLYSTSGTYTLVIIATYSGSPDCTESVQGFFTLPVCGCTDPAALNYDPLATIDDGSCVYPSWNCIPYNCIDPGDGSGFYTDINGGQTACLAACQPPVSGCTDPCANNYDPTATIDDGSCEYRACLDASASNQYWSCDCNTQKPSATIPDPNCCTYPCATPPTINTAVVDSTGTCTSPLADGTVSINVWLNNTATTYQVSWYDGTGTTLICADPYMYSGSPGNTTWADLQQSCGSGLLPGNYMAEITDVQFGCVNTVVMTVGTTIATQGCTDPTADNYDPNATCDDGSCVYCGCMDPLATNYNPNAVCDDGTCEYIIPENPCIPPNIDKRIKEIDLCLSQKGSEWLHKYKIGTADDCTIMNKWKLILIQYLLDKKGLTCLYNCADSDSPDITTIATCTTIAAAGGPTTGLNDVGFAGSSVTTGGGTLITTPATYFVAGNTLFFGDVITMPSGLIWTMTRPGNCTWGCYNPETNQGSTSGNWTQCVPANNITTPHNINYVDNFLTFVNKYCRDCKVNPDSQQNLLKAVGDGRTSCDQQNKGGMMKK